ncbi:hypothetical protein CCAL13119_06065 [Campylobacter sp. RM13119]|uniref:hypothetical protein n=1 Tax=Campylobacter californiensis TaxID=1032243 RepID=UPI00147388E6|nr:hypothetical protein [Campylobacter sp. RM13119]MBE3606521.1 hypothetical protein [Campylobacter sp. RM13119]
MFKILISIFVVFALGGCSFFYKQPSKPKNIVVQKPAKSSIKGFIKDLTYEDGGYCYTIIAVDTKNSKLPSANFCANKYYYDKGDLVYATFVGRSLESMLLIREGSSSGKISGIKKPQNTINTNRKNIKTKIEVPKEEHISF